MNDFLDIKVLSSLIDDSRKVIKISLKKTGKKNLTIVEGIDNDRKATLLKTWKKRYSCNGFIGDQVNLQGNHTDKLSKELENIGYKVIC